MKRLFLLLIVMQSVATLTQAQKMSPYQVLSGQHDSLFYSYMLGKASHYFEERRKSFQESVESLEALKLRQEELKKKFTHWVGALPGKTPLNAEVTNRIEREGILLENIVFESRPNHHVTANLFKPAVGAGPFPGVVVVCGHTDNGKAADLYQKVGVLLALNGIAALVVDPFGQGERYQFVNFDHRLAKAGGTYEHTMIDFAANLLGTDAVNFELWDNHRALDYLASREDIDPQRLGVTGNSGGGNQTTFLMAFDPRVKVAAPSCYIASKEAKFNTIGGQDGCQQFYHEGAMHVEENDFIIMRAPSPTMVLAAQQDFFSFEGTRKVVEEVGKVYNLYDKPDNFDFFYYNDGHGYSQPRREAAVGFFTKWFLNTDIIMTKTRLPFFDEKELTVTPTGQVATFYKEELLIQDILMGQYNELADSRKKFLTSGKTTIGKKITELIGYVQPAIPVVSQKGAFTEKGWDIEKYVITPEDGLPVPGLLIKREGEERKNLPLTIVVDSEGKENVLESGDIISRELAKGRAIFLADLRGFGETEDTRDGNNYIRGTNREWRTGRVGLFIHKSLLGQRTEDIITIVNGLSTLDGLNQKDIHLVGISLAGPAALHAAMLDSRIKKVEPIESLESWKTYLEDYFKENQVSNLVPEVLKYYDLPDLKNLLKKEKRLVE